MTDSAANHYYGIVMDIIWKQYINCRKVTNTIIIDCSLLEKLINNLCNDYVSLELEHFIIYEVLIDNIIIKIYDGMMLKEKYNLKELLLRIEQNKMDKFILEYGI